MCKTYLKTNVTWNYSCNSNSTFLLKENINISYICVSHMVGPFINCTSMDFSQGTYDLPHYFQKKYDIRIPTFNFLNFHGEY
jgi:hypothetical protein